MYLTAKGALGVRPASQLPEKSVLGYALGHDFRTDMVELAEYIIAVVTLTSRGSR
jgi:hypothetical protein